MNLPDPVLIGFFPKRTGKRPEGFGNDIVEEICSVSECISKGPDRWIEKWKHNEFGFFDSESLVQDLIAGEPPGFDVYAYRLFPVQFDNGDVAELSISSQLQGALDSFTFLGYDAANRSAGTYFECSALSCNGGALVFPVNRYCLFADLQVAYDATQEISRGEYEPGPWYLLEVHRKENG